MQQTRVLATINLSDALCRKIETATPDIDLQFLPQRLRRATRFGDPRIAEGWGRHLQEAHVLFTDLEVPHGLAPYAAHLRMIHVASAGIETLLETDLCRDTAVPISLAVGGANATAVAEFTLSSMLAMSKGLPRLLAHQRRKRWLGGHQPGLLAGKTLVLVGLGHINRDIAKMAKAFDMRVLGCSRTAAVGDRLSFVDEVFPVAALRERLGEGDFVVLAVPLTPETRGMIGRAELAAMRSTAYLVNVGRGALVQDEALLWALRDGEIAGAALDVFEEEPLPRSSPLWTLPNVLVSPHVAGISDVFLDSVVDQLCENLQCLAAGEPLLNLADRVRGY